MLGLIALIILVGRYRRRGHSWPGAILKGISTYLLGVIAIYVIGFFLIVGLGAADSALRPIVSAAIGFFPAPQPSVSPFPRVEGPLPERKAVATSTPAAQQIAAGIEARVTAVAIPTATPRSATIILSPGRTPTPAPGQSNLRAGCDPANPDARTCIPPGPPFDQGCGITIERRFTVLPPDPQGLDRDRDGVGCEPIT